MRAVRLLLIPVALAASACANLPLPGRSAPAVTPTPAPPGAKPGTPTDELPGGPPRRVAEPTPVGPPTGPAVPAVVTPPAVPGATGQAPSVPSAASAYPATPGNPVIRGTPDVAARPFIMEPGLYRCELNRRVLVRRIAADGQSVVVNWSNKDYTLQAVVSRAGALRYDDEHTGLAWITIPGKSMLLDTKKGQQLANECRL